MSELENAAAIPYDFLVKGRITGLREYRHAFPCRRYSGDFIRAAKDGRKKMIQLLYLAPLHCPVVCFVLLRWFVLWWDTSVSTCSSSAPMLVYKRVRLRQQITLLVVNATLTEYASRLPAQH